MEATSIDLEQQVTEMTIKLKKEFNMIAHQSDYFVKRTPRTDKLDDLQEKLYEACTLMHVMADVLIGHGRKTIDTFEIENPHVPNKSEFIEKLQNAAIKEIPGMVAEAMIKRIK